MKFVNGRMDGDELVFISRLEPWNNSDFSSCDMHSTLQNEKDEKYI